MAKKISSYQRLRARNEVNETWNQVLSLENMQLQQLTRARTLDPSHRDYMPIIEAAGKVDYIPDLNYVVNITWVPHPTNDQIIYTLHYEDGLTTDIYSSKDGSRFRAEGGPPS